MLSQQKNINDYWHGERVKFSRGDKMRSFFREYAMTIVSAVVLTVLLLMCTPIGDSTKIAILRVIGLYEDKIETVKLSFSPGGAEFDADKYQELHGGEKGVYITRQLITIDVPKNESIKEDVIPTIDENTIRQDVKYSKDSVKNSYKKDGTEDEYLVPNSTRADSDTSYTLAWKSKGTSLQKSDSRIDNGQLYIKDKLVGEFKEGTVFSWQGYDWKVLKIEGNEALVISEKVLDSTFDANSWSNGVAFGTSGEKNNYNSSNVQQKVNEFKNKLTTNAISNTRNITVGTKDSEYVFNENDDGVFLLSYQEVKKYFPTDNQRIGYNGVSPMIYWTRSGDRIKTADKCDPIIENGKEIDRICTGEKINNDNAMFVSYNGELISADASTEVGIRPALWLDVTKLSENEITIAE